MIRRPPRSTPFPTRRSSDLRRACIVGHDTGYRPTPWVARRAGAAICRSEEHTSELQSQSNLVCRLLLEKKKKKNTNKNKKKKNKTKINKTKKTAQHETHTYI